MKYTVKIGCLHRDLGDGSKTVDVYPSYKEAFEAKKENMRGNYQWDGKELPPDDEIENDWGYEYGYLSQDEFEIEIIDGEACITKEFSLYDGSQ